MFNFLKNCFKVSEKVSIDGLGPWIDERSAPVLLRLESFVENKFLEFRNVIEVLGSDVDVLDGAVINDPGKVQEKVQQVVLGHKDNYVRLVRQHILSFKVPDSASFESAMVFCKDASDVLNVFGGDSEKSYFATQHLFSAELEPVNNHVKRINSIVKSLLSEIDGSGIVGFNQLKKLVKDYHESAARLKELEQSLGHEQLRLSKAVEQRDVFKSQLDELTSSPEFFGYKGLKDQLAQVDEEISVLKSSVFDLFSPVSSALKKLNRLVPDRLIDDYSVNPFDALLGDPSFAILSHLDSVRLRIDELDIRDDKRVKVLDALHRLTRESLAGKRDDYLRLVDKCEDLKKKIRTNDAALRVKDKEYKLDHYSWSVENINKSIAELESQVSRIDLESLIVVIKEKLESLGLNVSIS